MRYVELDEHTGVPELADLLDLPVARLVKDGFEQLGLLLTIDDTLPFDDARRIAERRGVVAKRRNM